MNNVKDKIIIWIKFECNILSILVCWNKFCVIGMLYYDKSNIGYLI